MWAQRLLNRETCRSLGDDFAGLLEGMGNKAVRAADAVVTDLPERLLFLPGFLFRLLFWFGFLRGWGGSCFGSFGFFFLKKWLSVHPFPGTDAETNCYEVLLWVMCLTVTSPWWMTTAKPAWYLSPGPVWLLFLVAVQGFHLPILRGL